MSEETSFQAPASIRRSTGIRAFVDVAFVIDVSASMQPCLEAIRNKITKFLGRFFTPDASGNSPSRFSVCTYRSFNHGESLPLHLAPFTDDIREVSRQLDSMTAHEGAETEARPLLDALYTLLNRGRTPWRAEAEDNKWRHPRDATRGIVIITDAPFHPTLHLVPGAGLDDVVRNIEQEHVCLGLIAPEMDCYYNLAMADHCVYEPLEVHPGTSAARTLQEFLDNDNDCLESLTRWTRCTHAVQPSYYDEEL